jgi:4-hydroxybenzoate polyprenyltransferase
MKYSYFFSLLRVKHWVKNLVVFLPYFFAGGLFETSFASNFQLLSLLFFAFSFTSSVVYVLNDLKDKPYDQLHPGKRLRPIASGLVSSKSALLVLVLLGLFSLSLCLYIGFSSVFVGAYFLLNIAYTYFLKKIPIVDVTCISIGFVLRLLAGGAIIDVFVSPWMITIGFLLSISIAFAKRRDDLAIDGNKTKFRVAQNGYNLEFIDAAKVISFSVTLISYILYSLNDEVMKRIGSENLYLTSVFVFLGIMRYLQISMVEKNSGSPVKLLLKDRFLQVVILFWLISFSILIYG